MSPGGAKREVQSETDYEWIDLADFSAGCYDYTSIANLSPNIPAPNGSADSRLTFACVALPGGGLGPLPGVGATWDWPIEQGSGSVITYLGGLLIHDNLASGTEAIIIDEYDDGTNHFFFAASFILETATATSIVATTESSGGLNEFPYGSPYPFMTRMSAVDPTTTAGQPVVVFTSASFAQDNGTSGQCYVYPNPATPTLYNPLELIANPTPLSVTGQIIGYQGRVVILSGIGYDWPTGTGDMSINENINYTDPPNSTILPAQNTPGQQTVLVPEAPYGYGCGFSISAGELFLVKTRGGGVLLAGDIFSPNVTFLPGVQPTGEGYGHADSGPAGGFYCSVDNGAWMWNGGSTSAKISANLDDNFFHMDPAAENLSWYVKCIGDKVYFSNNWMFDTRTSSWWRYYATAAQGGVDLFWLQDLKGPSFYAAKLTWDDSDDTFLYRFDEELPTQVWQWKSLPIRLSTDRFVEVREIIVRASSNSNNTASTIKVTIFNAGTAVGSVTTPAAIGAEPTMIRMPIGAINAGATPYSSEDITLQINAFGNGGAAPNLHSVSLGWRTRAHSPTIGVSE